MAGMFDDLIPQTPAQGTGAPQGGGGMFDDLIPKQPMSWGDVASGALSNAPESAVKTAEAFVQPFVHPIETAENIGKLGIGALQKTGLAPGHSYEQYPEAVGKYRVEQ